MLGPSRVDVRPDGVAVISLNPIETRLGRSSRDALSDALRSALSDSFVRAIVLVSKHSQTFLITHTRELRDLTMRADALEEVDSRHRLADLLRSSAKPIVAAVHGRASGLGFEVALACAARVVSDEPHTVLELSDVELGIAPSLRGLCQLAHLIGHEEALRLAMFGTPIAASKALELGLASALVPKEELVERAAFQALELAQNFALSPIKKWSASLFETSRLGKRIYMARAKRAVVRELGRNAAAAAFMIAILEADAKGGAEAAKTVEREAFAQLVVASGSKRRMDVASAIDDLLSETFHHGSSIEKRVRAGGETERENAQIAFETSRQRASSVGIAELFIDFDAEPKVVFRSPSVEHARGRAAITVRHEPLGFLRRLACIYINEACWMVSRGSTIRDVDRALVEWGFPVGPFDLFDSLGAPEIARDCLALEQRHGSRFAAAPFLQRLADHARSSEARLYRPVSRPHARSWRALLDGPPLSGISREPDGALLERLGMAYPDTNAAPLVTREETQMRCALMLVNEALHCLHEKVIESTRDGNVVSVLGLGFPTFRGGVFGYVDTLGPRELQARLSAFTRQLGDRFAPAPILDELIDADSRSHSPIQSSRI